MKNKKLIYVLVPLTLIVWGLIFYRIFNGINDNVNIKPSVLNLNAKDNSIQPDTFQLIANYRDPFLGSPHKVKNLSGSPSKIVQPHTVPSPVAPDVQYYGIISNAKNKQKIGLIKVLGKSYLLKEGETAGTQMKIMRLFKDSLLVVHQKNRFIIKRT